MAASTERVWIGVGGSVAGDVQDAGNYSGGTLPSTGEGIRIDDRAQHGMTTNLNWGIALNSLIRTAGAKVAIGNEGESLNVDVNSQPTGEDAPEVVIAGPGLCFLTGTMPTVKCEGRHGGRTRFTGGAITTLTVDGDPAEVGSGATLTTLNAVDTGVTIEANGTRITTANVENSGIRCKRDIGALNTDDRSQVTLEETASISDGSGTGKAELRGRSLLRDLAGGTHDEVVAHRGSTYTRAGAQRDRTVTDSTKWKGGKFITDAAAAKTFIDGDGSSNPTTQVGSDEESVLDVSATL